MVRPILMPMLFRNSFIVFIGVLFVPSKEGVYADRFRPRFKLLPICIGLVIPQQVNAVGVVDFAQLNAGGIGLGKLIESLEFGLCWEAIFSEGSHYVSRVSDASWSFVSLVV